jgi:hypothetical protein
MPTACIAHLGSAAWERLPEALGRLRAPSGRVPIHPASDPGAAETLAAELTPEVDVLLVFGGRGGQRAAPPHRRRSPGRAADDRANRQAPAALLELVVEGGDVTKRLLGAPPKLTKRPGHR